jgi:hypothetical protein
MYIHTQYIRNTVATMLLMYTARYPLPQLDSIYSRRGLVQRAKVTVIKLRTEQEDRIL